MSGEQGCMRRTGEKVRNLRRAPIGVQNILVHRITNCCQAHDDCAQYSNALTIVC